MNLHLTYLSMPCAYYKVVHPNLTEGTVVLVLGEYCPDPRPHHPTTTAMTWPRILGCLVIKPAPVRSQEHYAVGTLRMLLRPLGLCTIFRAPVREGGFSRNNILHESVLSVS